MEKLGSLTNTEVLFFILGYQGGTIHQLVKELGLSHIDEILNADNEKMGELARLAQSKNVWKHSLYGCFRDKLLTE